MSVLGTDERPVCADCRQKVMGPLEVHRAVWCTAGPYADALKGQQKTHDYVKNHYSPMDAAQVLGHLGDKANGIDGGDFKGALLTLAFKCDRENLVRLSYGFPRTVAAVWDYRYGGGKQAMVDKVHDQWRPNRVEQP